MYIELCGLPGAGKTTLVNKVISEKELQVLTYSDYTRYIQSLHYAEKFVVYLTGFFRFYKLLKIIKNKAKMNRVSNKAASRWIRKAIFYFQTTLGFLRKSKKVIILDQGVFQYICNLCMKLCKDENEASICVSDMLCSLEGHFPINESSILYFDQTVECASLRAANRRGTYSYDLIKEDERCIIYEKLKTIFRDSGRECSGMFSAFYVEHTEEDVMLRLLNVLELE